VVILCSLVFAKSQFERGSYKDNMEKWRRVAEAKREGGGLEILRWDLLKRTKGNLRIGAEFPSEVRALGGGPINIVGFMVPLRDYRKMTEFLLLPLPIQCYFCESPPARDVILVQMREGEKVDLYEEPVLINGALELSEGPGVKFFYRITDASWGPGKEDDTLHKKTPAVEHQVHMQMQGKEEPLVESVEPPVPSEEPAPAI